jgi:hypothetical protein
MPFFPLPRPNFTSGLFPLARVLPLCPEFRRMYQCVPKGERRLRWFADKEIEEFMYTNDYTVPNPDIVLKSSDIVCERLASTSRLWMPLRYVAVFNTDCCLHYNLIPAQNTYILTQTPHLDKWLQQTLLVLLDNSITRKKLWDVTAHHVHLLGRRI